MEMVGEAKVRSASHRDRILGKNSVSAYKRERERERERVGGREGGRQGQCCNYNRC